MPHSFPPDVFRVEAAGAAAPVLVRDVMHGDVVTIEAQASLPDAVVALQTLGVRRLLVLEDGRLVGLLPDSEVSRALPPLGTAPWDAAYQAGRRRVSEVMRRKVFTARPGDKLAQAIQILLERHISGLPVVAEDGALLGILTLSGVLRWAAAHPQPGWGTVSERMSSEVVAVPPELPLAEAALRLSLTRLRVLPVVEGGALLGVLHEQDIRALTAREGAAHGPGLLGSPLNGQRVRDLMKPPGAEVLGRLPLAAAMQAMLAADVHGLPVVDDQRALLGVITVSDLLRAVVN